MTRVEYLRAASAARSRRWWSAAGVAAFSGIAVPIVFLAFRRGGGEVEDYCAASAFALSICAAAFLTSGSREREFRVPWFVAVVLALPFLQLIPVGGLSGILVSNGVRQLRSAIETTGIEPPSTVSIYPLATIRSWVLVAGCCAIFVLASGLVKRFPRKWPIALAPLAAAGILEALLGMRQYLHARAGQTATVLSSHGTFVNRDHFAVLLEACLGVAVGFAVAGLSSAHRKGWLGAGGAFFLAGTALAALSLTGIVLSSSRAGIAIGALMILVGFVAMVLGSTRGKVLKRTPLALAFAAAGLIAFHAAFPANVTDRFAALWENRGDPVRLAIWADSWRTAQSYPWAGSGLGTFGSAFRRSSFYVPRAHVDHAHSDYLELLAELGFPAAVFLLAGLGVGMWGSLRNIGRIRDMPERWLRGGCLLGAAAILMHATVDFPLRIPVLAAVFAALAGFAYGGGGGEAAFESGGASRSRVVAHAGLFAVLAALAVWTGFGNTGTHDADRLFARAEADFIRGDGEQAERLLQQAARANPFASGVWLKQAELAGLAGHEEASNGYLGLARQIEPFTLRTEWPLVQRQLREGRFQEAIPVLAGIARAVPEVRPGIYASALGAGIAVENIAGKIVPPGPEAAGDFVRLLIGRRRWSGIVGAVRSLRDRAGYSPPPDTLRLLLDRLFAADETSVMAELGEDLAAGSAKNAAFPWLVRPINGVAVRMDSRAVPPIIEIDFESPGNIVYGHVYRYFAVRASRQYILEAEARTERLGGGEPVRIAVRSPRRTLAVSPGLHGTTPWQAVRMAIATGPTERVIRVEVMRPRGPRAGDEISGRLYLRNVRLLQRGGPAT